MSAGGLVFMAVSWTAVLGWAAWAFIRVARAGRQGRSGGTGDPPGDP